MTQKLKKPKPEKRRNVSAKGKMSLYPLKMEDALRAAIATGPIASEDRKPKPKKKAL
jgi:hypothetical protein